ncbi:MAG: hypothetical protein GEV10_26930 [Streptosporangiales bacterium]|nr:hypothetical protein [Streptosporangiales bacterium]
MKVPTLRRNRPERLPGISGVARVGRRTKDLTKRLRPGDIAVIDHIDIDRVAAEALVGCRVAAVVNASPSISGRYPNLGPEIIVQAGIPLLDQVGDEVMATVEDGTRIRVDGDGLHVGKRLVATGVEQTETTVKEAMVDARSGLSVQLEAFAANTMEYLRRERELLLDGVGIPTIKTKLRNRHCLIVVRGYHYREDLQTLRPYIREYRPVLIGVDGGADALLDSGYGLDLIVGDMDSVSDRALTSGAEVVVHAYRDGRAPGLHRVEELGVDAVVFPATGTSEDIAMLLADDSGASLICAVGSHATLVEFLDKGRAGMASTFLTRLRVGGKLVDAKGVSRLYRSRISAWALILLAISCLVTILVAGAITPIGGVFGAWLSDLWDQIQYLISGLFS